MIRAGGMHGPPRLQSRQACLLQPRQHPYRDCIKSCRTMRGAAWTLRSFRLQGGHRVPFLVSRLWPRSDACLPFLFQVFLEQCYSLGTAAIQRGFVSRSYGSESKVHLVGFETSAKFVGGRMLDHFPLQSNHES